MKRKRSAEINILSFGTSLPSFSEMESDKKDRTEIEMSGGKRGSKVRKGVLPFSQRIKVEVNSKDKVCDRQLTGTVYKTLGFIRVAII